jgi:hypothetical protein
MLSSLAVAIGCKAMAGAAGVRKMIFFASGWQGEAKMDFPLPVLAQSESAPYGALLLGVPGGD